MCLAQRDIYYLIKHVTGIQDPGTFLQHFYPGFFRQDYTLFWR